MPTERIQRRIEALLDQADAAADANDWPLVADKARAVLAMDPENEDAPALLRAALANGVSAGASAPLRASPGSPAAIEVPAPVDTARLAELEAAAERSGNPLDRLEEGVFVGRARELDRLREALDEAFEGRGSVVMLVGEPGIGKTRTTQEIDAAARQRGAKTFWGRTHESSGAPPFWPWVQVGRAYRDQTPEDQRRREWQPYAVELQRLFPGLRELFPNLPEPPPVDSEDAQFALFDAWSSFLRSISASTPLVVVLDDLHWADRPTLGMLTHLAREIAHSRILVLGTYRDTDLDRTHPLSQALGELNREALFTRIPLRGLSEQETATYIRRTAGVEVPSDLASRIHAETEGNPFFLAQVVSLMTEEGAFTHGTATTVAIPEGVKEALGRRLDRLSPEANELLSVASVVGRECTHALLAALIEHDDDTLLALVEEALRARVFEETGTPGEYRFTHALMQDALYSELSTARRVRMHGRVAETLERLHARELDAHAAELAYHFAEAAVMNRSLAEKAVEYSKRAAEQAQASLAWQEAAALYQQALDVRTAVTDQEQVERCDLLLALGEVLLATGEPARVIDEISPAAVTIAEAHGDGVRIGRVSTLAVRAFDQRFGNPIFAAVAPDFVHWVELADRHAEPLSVERIYADRALMAIANRENRNADGQRLREHALSVARRLGDGNSLLTAAAWAMDSRAANRPEFSIAVAREFQSAAGDHVQVVPLGAFLRTCGWVLCDAGDRDAAERAWSQLATLAARSRHAAVIGQLREAELRVAFVDGRLREAAAIGEAVIRDAVQMVAGVGAHVRAITRRALFWLGRYEDAVQVTDTTWRSTGLPEDQTARRQRAYLSAAIGQSEAAQAALAESVEALYSNDQAEAAGIAAPVGILDLALAVGDRDAVRRLADIVAPSSMLAYGAAAYVTPARLLAEAALLLGKPEEARPYYVQAIEVTERIRFRPELALARLGLAELLLAHYPDERAAALEHLESAIGEFTAMGMQPSLERALRVRA